MAWLNQAAQAAGRFAVMPVTEIYVEAGRTVLLEPGTWKVDAAVPLTYVCRCPAYDI